MEYMIDKYPKIKKSVYMNDVFINNKGKGYYVIGNKENDSQLLVSVKDVSFFEKLMINLDGKNDIDRLVSQGIGTYNQVCKAIDLFRSHGLIEGTESKKSYNEAESLSIKLIKKTFNEVDGLTQKKQQDICSKVIKVSKVILAISIICFFYLITVNFSEIFGENSISYWLSYKSGDINSVFLGYLFINFSMVLMFLIHETFHVITGIEKGIRPAYFSFILFLGFMPMFYIKNRNIYTLEKKDIIKVLLAGVYSNLILFFILIDLFFVFKIEFIKILAMANLRMIFVNLIPISLTDGYFIYTLIFNRPNLRMKFHKFLADPRRLKEYKKSDLIFICVFLASILLTINFELMWIISDISWGVMYKVSLVIAINIIYILTLHYMDKKKFGIKR